MSLPKITKPIYNCILPSNNKKILYTPFSVKEEKLLLMAANSNESDDIISTIKQIINNCIVDRNFDIANLPFFDFEYLFIKIRSKSIGELIELAFKHETCGHVNKVEVNLEDVKIEKKEQDEVIKISDSIFVKMKYPSLDTISKYQELGIENIFDLMAECVEYVTEGEVIHNSFTIEELNQFIETLSKENVKDMIAFIGNMPTLAHTINFTCEKCKEELSTEVKGIKSFFL